ncbi:MAG: hydrogenase [Methanomicrobia archaeon]|nr:hydrogenase [Methanomicrobia archaeon]MCK4309942.1 hydrogenase [Methanomicrobia archaeon]
MIDLTNGTLETGYGVWSALYWLLGLAVLLLIVYLIYSFGEKTVKASGDKGKPFLSGNELSKEEIHVKAGNIYWGFTEALKSYYTPLEKGHTGNVNDYVSWLVVILAVVLILAGGL